YNGANDDATGTTAVLQLARYFNQLKQNTRTLIFVAFTAEEIGGYGSLYFSQQYDPNKIVALFNVEVIGTESKWGPNSAYLTGFEQSDMGKILQDNVKGSPYSIYPDPYPDQQLFFRSDNIKFARWGVPAHTLSTSRMEADPEARNKDADVLYHTPDDEYGSLDMRNMTAIIKAIARSAQSIITGKDTPGRIPKRAED
ncbi:MAG: M28 family metallopeptidase, partial [Chitinophagaceae bacterium]